MSLPYCVEICRGQGGNYSTVSGTFCYCLQAITATKTQYLPLGHCDLPCPGNPYQFCGNGVNFTLLEGNILVCNIPVLKISQLKFLLAWVYFVCSLKLTFVLGFNKKIAPFQRKLIRKIYKI